MTFGGAGEVKSLLIDAVPSPSVVDVAGSRCAPFAR